MRQRLPLLSLVGWTLFVWVTRMNNIVQDDDLSAGGMAWRLGAAAFFVALAVALLVATRRSPARVNAVLGVFVVWTIGWWSIRGVGILVDNHDVGFKVVHTILMVVSIGVAMWAWRRRDR